MPECKILTALHIPCQSPGSRTVHLTSARSRSQLCGCMCLEINTSRTQLTAGNKPRPLTLSVQWHWNGSGWASGSEGCWWARNPGRVCCPAGLGWCWWHQVRGGKSGGARPGKRSPGQQGLTFAQRHQSKAQHQTRTMSSSGCFWPCTGNTRQPILVCSFFAAPLLRGERAVNGNSEHAPSLAAGDLRTQWGRAGAAVRVPSQPPSDDTFAHRFVFRP